MLAAAVFGSAVFTPHDFRIRSLLASKFRVRTFLSYCWPQGGFGWLLAAGGFGSACFLPQQFSDPKIVGKQALDPNVVCSVNFRSELVMVRKCWIQRQFFKQFSDPKFPALRFGSESCCPRKFQIQQMLGQHSVGSESGRAPEHGIRNSLRHNCRMRHLVASLCETWAQAKLCIVVLLVRRSCSGAWRALMCWMPCRVIPR